jgi:hypothetical protein
VGFKAKPNVTTEKAYPRPYRWQSKVRHKAGNGGEAAHGPQEDLATLTPNIPGMQTSGYNALDCGVEDLSA